MPFPEKIRNYSLEVANHRCQAIIYSEDRGFFRCENTTHLEAHHIEPAEWQLVHGEDPNQSTPLVLCKKHHSGGEGLPFEDDFSMHPNMGAALDKYHAGNKQAFTEAAHENSQLARQGIIYWNNGADDYYRELSIEAQTRYLAEHPDQKKPTPKPHKDFKPKPKWWDEI